MYRYPDLHSTKSAENMRDMYCRRTPCRIGTYRAITIFLQKKISYCLSQKLWKGFWTYEKIMQCLGHSSEKLEYVSSKTAQTEIFQFCIWNIFVFQLNDPNSMYFFYSFIILHINCDLVVLPLHHTYLAFHHRIQ